MKALEEIQMSVYGHAEKEFELVRNGDTRRLALAPGM